jgi:hypothetical protein
MPSSVRRALPSAAPSGRTLESWVTASLWSSPERHVCVGGVLLVGGELADDLGAFEELLGLGEPARNRALIAFAQSRRHRAVRALEPRRSRRSVP